MVKLSPIKLGSAPAGSSPPPVPPSWVTQEFPFGFAELSTSHYMFSTFLQLRQHGPDAFSNGVRVQQEPSEPETLEKQETTEDSQASATDNVDEDLDAGSPDNGDEDLDAGSPDKDGAKMKRNKCKLCKKKVGLTGFTCRCAGLFCSVHRYSNEHDCTFDYRELGAEEIRRNNPLVQPDKIQKL